MLTMTKPAMYMSEDEGGCVWESESSGFWGKLGDWVGLRGN